MEAIKQLILETAPEAVLEEKANLTVTVAPDDLRALAIALKNDPASRFDFLIQLTGVDEGEN